MAGTSGVAKLLATWLQKGAPNETPKWPTKVCFDGGHIPALTAYEYRGYIITAWARPEFPNGSTSVGIVYKGEQLGSITQVKESRASYLKVKSKPRNREWSCARNGLISSSDLEATRRSREI